MITYHYIPSKWNISDLGTKPHLAKRAKILMYLIGIYDLFWNDYVGRDILEELGTDTTKQYIRIFRIALSGGN